MPLPTAVSEIPKYNKPELLKTGLPATQVDLLIKHPCYKTLCKINFIAQDVRVATVKLALGHMTRLITFTASVKEYIKTLEKLYDHTYRSQKKYRLKSDKVARHHVRLEELVGALRYVTTLLEDLNALDATQQNDLLRSRFQLVKVHIATLQDRLPRLLRDIEKEVRDAPAQFFRSLSVQVDDEGSITDITFLINRPSFKVDTYRGLFQHYPQHMQTECQLNEGLDICHIKSNEQLKSEIQRMFLGQPFREVADFLYEQGYATNKIESVSDIQQALFKYWSTRFNDPQNLEPGVATDNQNLGRLVGILRKHFVAGKASFKTFYLNMKAFGMENPDRPDQKIKIDSWQMLVDLYYNANNDFSLKKDSAESELFESAADFSFVYRL